MSKPVPAAPPGNRSRFNRFLDAIETAGNKLPDPVFIFIILCVVILIASWLAALTGVSAVNPATGETITAVNLLRTCSLSQPLL